MARRMDAKLGDAQLSLFEVDSLLSAAEPRNLSHRPSSSRAAVRPRQSTSAPRPDKPAASSAADSLLSPEQVACRCGLSRKAVYRAVARGELRAARILSRLRIDPHDVDAWIRTNIVDAGCPVPAPRRSRLPATTGLRRLLPEP